MIKISTCEPMMDIIVIVNSTVKPIMDKCFHYKNHYGNWKMKIPKVKAEVGIKTTMG